MGLVTLALIFVGAILLSISLLSAPGRLTDAPRHTLICCAHSDDCVIAGAEYAIGAIQSGLTVEIFYLTCSDEKPDSKLAQIRRNEAEKAWGSLGIDRNQLTSANLPASPVDGPRRYSSNQLLHAKEKIRLLIKALPLGSAILIPADGEAHVDHTAVREVTLLAVQESNRPDLIVYEVPEYNNYLSLKLCPTKTVRSILRYIPILGRFIDPYYGSTSFIAGLPGQTFAHEPGRLQKKQKLLRYFVSQDVEKLHRFFAYPSHYRKLPDLALPSRKLISAYGGLCDITAIFFRYGRC